MPVRENRRTLGRAHQDSDLPLTNGSVTCCSTCSLCFRRLRGGLLKQSEHVEQHVTLPLVSGRSLSWCARPSVRRFSRTGIAAVAPFDRSSDQGASSAPPPPPPPPPTPPPPPPSPSPTQPPTPPHRQRSHH